MKRFDRFILDVANHGLWREHTRISLMPKPFAVLAYLVEHAGRLVRQDELLKAVWPDAYVQPDVLRKHVKQVREALGDRAEGSLYVQTVPKCGYRFIAPVVADGDRPSVLVDRAAAASPVGRGFALAALEERLAKALAGERQIVFVAGEPGIGKTTVVETFAHTAPSAQPMRVARGQAVEGFGGKEPYYPLLEALSRLGRGDNIGYGSVPRTVAMLLYTGDSCGCIFTSAKTRTDGC